MKNSLFIFAVIFFYHSVSAQTFTALNSGIGNQLNGIRFLSDSKGIVVGDGGKILMTTNALNWHHKISGVTTNLKAVEYINASTIIVVGDWGTILKSTNGGMAWTQKNSGTSEMLYSVHVNGSNIYACGQNGVILKSTNEGDTWTSINPGQGAHTFDIFFTSPNVGFAVGNDAYIHRTTNGGASWTTLYSFDSGISEDFQLRSIYFTDANNGYIVGKNLWANQSIFLRSTDGGITWTKKIVYGTSYVDIKFLNSDVGYLISQNENSNTGLIYKTTDGGANWSFLTSLAKPITDITFPSTSVAYTCGFNGTIYKSSNINLGIEDLENDQAISIYPNPSSEKIFINLDSSIQNENLTIELFTISGEKIISQSNSEWVDVSEIPSGSYLLKVQSETSSWTKKLIKE